MTNVDVEVVVAGELEMPRAYALRRPNRLRSLPAVLRPGDDTITAPLLWYVLRHPTEGVLLVDTGVPRDVDFGRALGLLFRGLKHADQPFDEQLRGRGIEPADVKTVVMTHLHGDHTAGMPLLPNAEFVIGRREWAAVTGRMPVLSGAVGHHLPPQARVKQVDFDADGVPHGPFTSTIDLLGDGSVRLLSTPGHSAGHLSVLVEREQGPLLVVGDAAYTRESIATQTLPLFTDDDERYAESLRQIAAFADSESSATIVPTHDPRAHSDV